MSLKKRILEACQAHVRERLKSVHLALADLQQQLGNDSRSTAGDKHETGRAMLHLEQEQLSKQLVELNQKQAALNTLSLAESNGPIHEGHLIETTTGYYYLSIGLGRVSLDEMEVNIISAQSPIGKRLVGHNVGDEINFNGKTMSILSVR